MGDIMSTSDHAPLSLVPSRELILDSPHSTCPALTRELWATGLIEVVSTVAYLCFQNPFFIVIGGASLTFFATRCFKHLFDGYKFMNWIESSAYTLSREAPYLYLIAFLVAIVSCHIFIELSLSFASLNAILSAFTFDPAMRRGFLQGEQHVHL
jgi:hypothetical protein